MKPEVIPKNIPLIYYYNIKVKDKKKKTDLKKNEILKSILKKLAEIKENVQYMCRLLKKNNK